MYRGSIRQDEKISTLNDRIAAMAVQHGNETARIIRECDSEKTAMRSMELAKVEARLKEKEAFIDEALMEAQGVIRTQKQARKNVSKALKEVAK